MRNASYWNICTKFKIDDDTRRGLRARGGFCTAS
jgi:hypothetical protein